MLCIGSTLIGKISDSLHDQRWDEALEYLHQLAQSPQQQKLKLGTLQRWVRDCDAAASKVQKSFNVGDGDNGASTVLKRDSKIMKVLDAVLRVADPSMIGSADSDYEDEDDAVNQDHGMVIIPVTDTVDTDQDGVVRYRGAWDCYPERKDANGNLVPLGVEGHGGTVEPCKSLAYLYFIHLYHN
jgi:hypothetical protein